MKIAFDLEAHAADLHGLSIQDTTFIIRPCCHLNMSGTIEERTKLDSIKGVDGIIDLDYYDRSDALDLIKILLTLNIPFTVY